MDQRKLKQQIKQILPPPPPPFPLALPYYITNTTTVKSKVHFPSHKANRVVPISFLFVQPDTCLHILLFNLEVALLPVLGSETAVLWQDRSQIGGLGLGLDLIFLVLVSQLWSWS